MGTIDSSPNPLHNRRSTDKQLIEVSSNNDLVQVDSKVRRHANPDPVLTYTLVRIGRARKGPTPMVYEYQDIRKTAREWATWLNLDSPQAFYLRLMAYKKGEIGEHEVFKVHQGKERRQRETG